MLLFGLLVVGLIVLVVFVLFGFGCSFELFVRFLFGLCLCYFVVIGLVLWLRVLLLWIVCSSFHFD